MTLFLTLWSRHSRGQSHCEHLPSFLLSLMSFKTHMKKIKNKQKKSPCPWSHSCTPSLPKPCDCFVWRTGLNLKVYLRHYSLIIFCFFVFSGAWQPLTNNYCIFIVRKRPGLTSYFLFHGQRNFLHLSTLFFQSSLCLQNNPI